MAESYTISAFIAKQEKEGNLRPLSGLDNILNDLTRSGYRIFVDLGPEGEEVSVVPRLARYAAQEVDVATFHIRKAGRHRGSLVVVPENDLTLQGGPHTKYEWLADWSYSDRSRDIDDICTKHTREENNVH